jgi:hypothetical protein
MLAASFGVAFVCLLFNYCLCHLKLLWHIASVLFPLEYLTRDYHYHCCLWSIIEMATDLNRRVRTMSLTVRRSDSVTAIREEPVSR